MFAAHGVCFTQVQLDGMKRLLHMILIHIYLRVYCTAVNIEDAAANQERCLAILDPGLDPVLALSDGRPDSCR